MATRAVLADLIGAYAKATGNSIAIESVGGVDAAKRVQAGEAFDAVFLAADAIDKLIASGHVLVGSRLSECFERITDSSLVTDDCVLSHSRHSSASSKNKTYKTLFFNGLSIGTILAVQMHRRLP